MRDFSSIPAIELSNIITEKNNVTFFTTPEIAQMTAKPIGILEDNKFKISDVFLERFLYEHIGGVSANSLLNQFEAFFVFVNYQGGRVERENQLDGSCKVSIIF